MRKNVAAQAPISPTLLQPSDLIYLHHPFQINHSD